MKRLQANSESHTYVLQSRKVKLHSLGDSIFTSALHTQILREYVFIV